MKLGWNKFTINLEHWVNISIMGGIIAGIIVSGEIHIQLLLIGVLALFGFNAYIDVEMCKDRIEDAKKTLKHLDELNDARKVFEAQHRVYMKMAKCIQSLTKCKTIDQVRFELNRLRKELENEVN